MTDQEKIYRIAEYCGAKWIRLAKQVNEKAEKRSLVMPDDPVLNMYDCTLADGSEQICQIHALPNYLSDLNAMHEVEKMLSKKEWVIYGQYLDRLNVFPLIHATAKQRAEAFLKTIEDNS